MLTCVALAGALYASVEISETTTAFDHSEARVETHTTTQSYLLPITELLMMRFDHGDSPNLHVEFDYLYHGVHQTWNIEVPIEADTPTTLIDFLQTCPKDPS